MKEENGMTSSPMFWVLYIVLLGYVIFTGNPSSEEGEAKTEGIAGKRCSW